jgi:hypothetical protein
VSVPEPSRAWFDGGQADVNHDLPVPVPARPGRRRPAPATIDVHPLGGGPLPVGLEFDADTLSGGWQLRTAGVVPSPEPLPLDEGIEVDGWLRLPQLSGHLRGEVVLRPPEPLESPLLYTVATDTGIVSVSDSDNGAWLAEDFPETAWHPLLVQRWTPPGAVPVREVRLSAGLDAGLVVLGGVPHAQAEQHRANEAARADTAAALAADAAGPVPAKIVLRPDSTYRVEVALTWSGRGQHYAPASSPQPLVQTFTFRTAAASSPRPAPSPAAPGLSFESMVATALISLSTFDESVLADADLARYVAGTVPPDRTAEYFCDDPVQVLFSVDHLPELAAAYDRSLVVVARRTDAPPRGDDAGPAAPAVTTLAVVRDVVAPSVAALSVAHLSALDQVRCEVAADMEASALPCRIRRPGGVVQPPLRLDPAATYDVELRLAPLPVPADPAAVGVVLHRSTLRTSRYRSPARMVERLGLTAAGAAPLPGLLVPADAVALLGGAAAWEQVEQALRLDGAEAPLSAQAWVLWTSPGGAQARALGVLLECPEPLHRPGRVELGEVRLAGHRLTGRALDPRRSRLVALAPAPLSVAAGAEVALDLVERPPGGQPSPRTVRASAAAPPPGLDGLLA